MPAEVQPPAASRWSLEHLFPSLRLLADDQATRLMAIGVLIGAAGGLAAGVLDTAIALMGRVLLGSAAPSLAVASPWFALIGPVAGGLLAGLAIRFGTREGRPTGISDVIDGTWNRQGKVSLRDATWSAVGAAATVGGGQSGGREGPIVQLSAGVTSRLCRWLELPPSQARVLVAAGAAAGIAASFDTPIGGAFFALEIILGDFALRMFGPVVAATVTGNVVGQALLGDRVALRVPAFELEHPVELIFYLLLGVVCGGVAAALKRGLARADVEAAKLPIPRWLQPAAAGLVVGAMASLGMNAVMGNGYAYMQALLSGEVEAGIATLAVLLVAKLVATMVTWAARGGAGIFAPTLFVGGITGVLFGTLVSTAWPTLTSGSGAYGLVGMGAVAAAVTHAPITIALMLFEMTGNYAVILPLLLSLAVASVVSSALGTDAVYLQSLRARGVNVERKRESLVMYDLRVRDLMREHEVESVPPDAPFAELAARFMRPRVHEVFLVDPDRRYHGVLVLEDVKQLLASPPEQMSAREVQRAEVPTLEPDAPIAAALPIFFRAAMDELPVVDEGGRLVGVLCERDVIGAYDREVLKHHSLLARIEQKSTADESDNQTHFFELPPGLVMESVEITGQLAGRSLSELRLTRRYGCTVLAVVKTHEGRERRLPAAAGLRLEEGDRIVVVGPAEDVARLAGLESDFEETQEIPRM